MDFNDAISKWAVALRGAGRPRTTIRTRTQHLHQLAGAHTGEGPWSLTTADLLAWCGSQDWAPETRHSVRSSLRGFYAWGHAAGHTTHNPAAGLPSIPRRPPAPNPLPEAALASALLAAPVREQLMIHLAARCGLRRGEVAQVHTGDVVTDLLGHSLIVRGKGGRRRTVPLPDDLADLVLTRGPGYIFPGQHDGHISAQWVGDLIGRLLPAGWTMHTLRHRFATRAYAFDRDVLTVQALLGHANPGTTQRYVRLPDDALRRTVAAVSA
ncbi:tyrosine-type recombinase/integrase [Pseudactinotalea sp. Z1748]|uniref:tyrosine-type recombinase/integrase n=1 Tax=Pseudactinotalea sp. Z1748 TaxID=3413027 RepID=UPI003C7CE516